MLIFLLFWDIILGGSFSGKKQVEGAPPAPPPHFKENQSRFCIRQTLLAGQLTSCAILVSISLTEALHNDNLVVNRGLVVLF